MSAESDALELAIAWHQPHSPSSARANAETVVETATALQDWIDADATNKMGVQFAISHQRPNDPNANLPSTDSLLAAATTFVEYLTPPEA